MLSQTGLSRTYVSDDTALLLHQRAHTTWADIDLCFELQPPSVGWCQIATSLPILQRVSDSSLISADAVLIRVSLQIQGMETDTGQVIDDAVLTFYNLARRSQTQSLA